MLYKIHYTLFTILLEEIRIYNLEESLELKKKIIVIFAKNKLLTTLE
jgi:hypothetical protein